MSTINTLDTVDNIQEALLGREFVSGREFVDFEDVLQMVVADDYDKFLMLMLDVVRFGKNSKKIEEFSDYMIEECRIFAESIKED